MLLYCILDAVSSILKVECAPRTDILPPHERIAWILGSWWPASQQPYTACTSIWCICSPCAAICSPCTSVFLPFGRPGDPPGHNKTMKINVLSSKFKVLLISKRYPFDVAFGCLLDYFGHHFGRLCAPWGSFWRCLGSQSASKIAKRLIK